MTQTSAILLIDFCNFEDYPIGGYLSMAKNLMQSFGNQLQLVGITTVKQDPVGKWYKKEIDGGVYDFFALARYNQAVTKHLIPDRLALYMLLKYYRKEILEIGAQNAFIQRQEVMQAVRNFNFPNICYCFGGLENPLAISKYKFARHLATIFERSFFISLKQAGVILASGDNRSIRGMIDRSKGLIEKQRVVQFPTRINTDVFCVKDKIEARLQLGISATTSMIVTTGRLASLKGWKFMIDCFAMYQKELEDSRFYLIGEGEDRQKITEYCAALNLSESVILTGRKKPEEVARYLNASDLFIMGSYKEGWSTSLMESLACGVPSCVTDFSSAAEIIADGVNGFVIKDHDKSAFVEGMMKALKLQRPVENSAVVSFSTGRLKSDLLNTWHLL